MAHDEALADRVRLQLARRQGIEAKKLFGGMGFLLRGHLLVGVWKDSLVVRVGRAAFESSLRRPFVRPFDITGKSLSGWVVVEPIGLEEDGQLAGWIQQALAFVRTLPAKSPSRRSPRPDQGRRAGPSGGSLKKVPRRRGRLRGITQASFPLH